MFNHLPNLKNIIKLGRVQLVALTDIMKGIIKNNLLIHENWMLRSLSTGFEV